MKKDCFKVLAFLPLLFFMAITNWYIDPAGIYHNNYKEIADALLDGKKAGFGSGNVKERLFKYNMILDMPEQIDCVAIGPSLIMGVRADDTGAKSFINLGHSSANFYDLMAQFGLLDINGKKVKRVIFCVDSYFFDENLNESSDSNTELKPYAEWMIKKLEGKEETIPNEKNRMLKTKLLQLVSITYFQACFNYIYSNKKIIIEEPRWSRVDENYDKYYYMPDGSWVYSKKFQNNTIEDVKEEIEKYDIEYQFSKDGHISDYRKKIFEKLINYMLEQGTEVEFFLCPLPPSLYDRVEKDSEHYYVLDELEAYAKEIANQYDLKLIGSYNPYNLRMSDGDFYDARHVRHELLGKYFDFTGK